MKISKSHMKNELEKITLKKKKNATLKYRKIMDNVTFISGGQIITNGMKTNLWFRNMHAFFYLCRFYFLCYPMHCGKCVKQNAKEYVPMTYITGLKGFYYFSSLRINYSIVLKIIFISRIP